MNQAEALARLRQLGAKRNKKYADFVTELITTHGLEGFRWYRASRDLGGGERWVALHEAPAECPWRTKEPVSPAGFVQAQFAPIAADFKVAVATLEKSCLGIFTEKIGSQWYLFYLVGRAPDGPSSWDVKVLAGGPPASGDDFNEAARRFQWTLPPLAAPLYGLHDGFGEVLGQNEQGLRFNVGSYLLPVRKMEPVESYGFSSRAGQPFLDADCLLSFFIDDVGNRLCFFRWSGDHRVKAYHHDRETRFAAVAGNLVATLHRTLRGVISGRWPT